MGTRQGTEFGPLYITRNCNEIVADKGGRRFRRPQFLEYSDHANSLFNVTAEEIATSIKRGRKFRRPNIGQHVTDGRANAGGHYSGDNVG